MMPSLTLALLAPFFDTVFSQIFHTILPMLMLCSWFVHCFNTGSSRKIERSFHSMKLAVLSGLLCLSWPMASSQAEHYYVKAALCDPNVNKSGPHYQLEPAVSRNLIHGSFMLHNKQTQKFNVFVLDRKAHV